MCYSQEGFFSSERSQFFTPLSVLPDYCLTLFLMLCALKMVPVFLTYCISVPMILLIVTLNILLQCDKQLCAISILLSLLWSLSKVLLSTICQCILLEEGSVCVSSLFCTATVAFQSISFHRYCSNSRVH